MNRRSLLGAAPLALVALGLGACTLPIYNVERRNFANSGTLAQRTEQIRRAGVGLGWQMDPMRPGLMRATLNLRSHVALIDIAYDEQGFSIRYVDSVNLDYDGTRIHKNYNSWIENLERAISQTPPVNPEWRWWPPPPPPPPGGVSGAIGTFLRGRWF